MIAAAVQAREWAKVRDVCLVKAEVEQVALSRERRDAGEVVVVTEIERLQVLESSESTYISHGVAVEEQFGQFREAAQAR